MSLPHPACITNKRLHPAHKGLEWSYCWIVYIGGYILCFYVERNLQLIVSANSGLQLLLSRQFAAWSVKRTHNAALLKHLLRLTHINDNFSTLRLSACLYLSYLLSYRHRHHHHQKERRGEVRVFSGFNSDRVRFESWQDHQLVLTEVSREFYQNLQQMPIQYIR